MKFTLKAQEIYLENEILRDASVTVKDGKIAGINQNLGEVIDLGELRLLPGLLDIHVHGGNGVDTMDSTPEAIQALSCFKIKEGVTTFCPTTVTTSLEKTIAAIKNADAAKAGGLDGAKSAGVFLEGPYITEKYRGAHPTEFIREIELSEIEQLINAGEVISFAIAPDKDKAANAIELLRGRGVNVRIGHSAANGAQTKEAIRMGANIAIHTFNAMSPFTHREPGMAGTVLGHDGIYGEIICDLIHVAPDAVKLLVKAKGTDKVILITDCMMAGGLEDGNYMLGEMPVTVVDSIARTPDGALAGSTLALIKAVKNMCREINVSLADAVKMATINPAKAIGLDKSVGSIAIGKCADFVAIDNDFNVRFVMVDGVVKLK